MSLFVYFTADKKDINHNSIYDLNFTTFNNWIC